MNHRPKIGVIAGTQQHPRSAFAFEQLTPHFDVSLFAIDNKRYVGNYKGSLPLHVFENLKDMPGYMRSLEEFTADFDVLVGIESSRLATFQMIRVAAKHQIPTAVVVNEFHPYFYNDYPNIRAVQVDVLGHALKFWPSSRLAESMLKVEGVTDERLFRIPAAVDISQFSPNASRRAKFRDHIGVHEDSIVILANREIEAWTYAEELLHGFRLLYVTNPQLASRLKLLFVGSGSLERDIKYRCYDLNMGNSVIFIHQDALGFARDLYAASDFVFCARKMRGDYHEEFPLSDLEAIATGAIPIYKMGSLLSEYCDNQGLPLQEVTFQSIADGLAGILTKPGGIKRSSNASRMAIMNECDPTSVGRALLDEMDLLVSVSRGMKKDSTDAAARVDASLQRIRTGQETEPLLKVEELLLMTDLKSVTRAALLTEKGLLLSNLSRFDEALEALHDAIRLDESNMAAYRGLGYLSLKSHSHEEAISFFKKALSRNDKDIESMFGVGLVHRRLGLNDEALYWLERCLMVEPGNPKILTALSQTCLDCHAPHHAIATLERIQGQMGEDVGLLLTLGQLYLRDGKAEIGNEMVSRALDMQRQGAA